MERLLIVNADDFGLSKGQNYGIIEACRNGIVTSRRRW
ncbi:chito-oligosaccharide deacetylase [Escherichia coli]|nr:chito-oligosaccharide deacetylase [Escherichia coli]